MKLLDYSGRPPHPDTIKGAGYSGVCRYLSSTDLAHPRSKDLTRAEADAMRGAGLDVVVVWETTANRTTSGAAGGATDGKAARAEAEVCGAPDRAAIYYAVDFDAQAPMFATIAGYLGAAANACAPHPVGVYGSYSVCEAMLRMGAARYAWQTVAWSGGKRLATAHLYQRGAVTLDGTACDVNEVLQPDYGGWADPAAPGPTPIPGRNQRMLLVQPEGAGGVFLYFGKGDYVPIEDPEDRDRIIRAGVPIVELTAATWAIWKAA